MPQCGDFVCFSSARHINAGSGLALKQATTLSAAQAWESSLGG